MKFECAVAVRDFGTLPSGHKRASEGDVIVIRQYPCSWGRKEIDKYIIVPLESNFYTKQELQDLCGRPGPDNKNSLSINLFDLNGADHEKLRDTSYKYQPFKKKTHVVEKLSGVKVDCESPTLDSEEERFFPTSIIYDKIEKKHLR